VKDATVLAPRMCNWKAEQAEKLVLSFAQPYERWVVCSPNSKSFLSVPCLVCLRVNLGHLSGLLRLPEFRLSEMAAKGVTCVAAS
jgi:hypothetical protein